MVASARYYQQPLSVLMIDIDQFKNSNDQYGHNSGDQVIIALADAIRAIARDSDIAFRFGGDEFLILLGNTDSNGAEVVAALNTDSQLAAAKIRLSELNNSAFSSAEPIEIRIKSFSLGALK